MKSWKIPFYTAAALCAAGFGRSGYANLYIAAKDMPTYCERVFDPQKEILPITETAPTNEPNEKARDDMRASLEEMWQTLGKSVNPIAPPSFADVEKAAESGKKNAIIDKAFAGLEARLQAANVHDSVNRVLYDLRQPDPEYMPENTLSAETNAIRKKLNDEKREAFQRRLTQTAAFLIGADTEKITAEGAELLKSNAKSPLDRIVLYRALQNMTEKQRSDLLLAAERTKSKNRDIPDFMIATTHENPYEVRKKIALLKSFKQQVFFMKSDENFKLAVQACRSLCKNTSKHIADIAEYQNPEEARKQLSRLETEYIEAIKTRNTKMGEGHDTDYWDDLVAKKAQTYEVAKRRLAGFRGQSVDIGLEFWVGEAHYASLTSNKVDPIERQVQWETANDAAEEHQICMGSGYVEGVKGVGKLFWDKLFEPEMLKDIRCHDTARTSPRRELCKFNSVNELEIANMNASINQTERIHTAPREAPERLGQPKEIHQ